MKKNPFMMTEQEMIGVMGRRRQIQKRSTSAHPVHHQGRSFQDPLCARCCTMDTCQSLLCRSIQSIAEIAVTNEEPAFMSDEKHDVVVRFEQPNHAVAGSRFEFVNRS